MAHDLNHNPINERWHGAYHHQQKTINNIIQIDQLTKMVGEMEMNLP